MLIQVKSEVLAFTQGEIINVTKYGNLVSRGDGSEIEVTEM